MHKKLVILAFYETVCHKIHGCIGCDISEFQTGSLESFWNGKIGLEMTNYALKSHCVMHFQIFNLDNFLSCL